MAEHIDPSEPARNAWDEDLARELIGKTVLIGLTYLAPDGELQRREQIFGSVTSADSNRCITLELDGARVGDVFKLPPATDVFERAPMGVYELSSTGEKVDNPAFLVRYTVRARADS